ncbi:MAG: hypothetical protein JW882_02620 [Deltaproteobacteria bacterium]|nr:hypothetical protein [Deltaproteobacteria bacterium]
MKRLIIITVLFVCMIIAPFANAKLDVKCEITEISTHELLVTLGWKVTVQSDKSWDACDLVISFLDDKGEELFVIRETRKVKAGNNSFSGSEICDSRIWKRVRKYVTSFDCIF